MKNKQINELSLELFKINVDHLNQEQAATIIANLQDKEFEIQVVENGLLITPIKKSRKGWEEQFKRIPVSQTEQDFNETNRSLDHYAELATGETWEW